MMNIPPSEAKSLTLAEYDGLMFNWNAAHSSEDDPELGVPTDDKLAERRARLEAKGVKVLY